MSEGETAAITDVIRNDADLVLLDEREGRKTARRHGHPIAGVIGILLRAAEDETIGPRSILSEYLDQHTPSNARRFTDGEDRRDELSAFFIDVFRGVVPQRAE